MNSETIFDTETPSQKNAGLLSKSLLGFNLEHLKKTFLENGFSALDAKRVFPWIHKKLSQNFDDMSDLPSAVREKLKERFSLSRGKCVVLQTSVDGTQKALLEFCSSEFGELKVGTDKVSSNEISETRNSVETVYIPSEKRNTICVSSQVGCAMGCKFCHTGTQGFVRNLSSSEIMAQILFWKDKFPISNIVFMGMGEPLLNAENLFEVLSVLLDSKTHNFSRNKITVSTCGIAENALEKLAKFGVKLAISLHAPNDEIRSSLMPINNRYNIEKVLKSAAQYRKNSNTGKITFEYLLLRDVNDSQEHAKQLIRLLKNFPAKVNLIIYNDWPNSNFKGTSREKADSFAMKLIKSGLRATIRKSAGDDILAACGQLKSKVVKSVTDNSY